MTLIPKAHKLLMSPAAHCKLLKSSTLALWEEALLEEDKFYAEDSPVLRIIEDARGFGVWGLPLGPTVQSLLEIFVSLQRDVPDRLENFCPRHSKPSFSCVKRKNLGCSPLHQLVGIKDR